MLPFLDKINLQEPPAAHLSVRDFIEILSHQVISSRLFNLKSLEHELLTNIFQQIYSDTNHS